MKIWIILFIIPLVEGTCPEIKAIEPGFECWFGCTSIGEIYRINFEFKPLLYDWRTIASSVVGEACTYTSPEYTLDDTLSELHLLSFQNQKLRQNGVYRCTLEKFGKEEFHSKNVTYFHGTVSTPMPTATESTSSNTTDEQSTAVLTDSSSTSMPTQTESTSSNTPDKLTASTPMPTPTESTSSNTTDEPWSNITSIKITWFGIGVVTGIGVTLAVAAFVYKWKKGRTSACILPYSYKPVDQDRGQSINRTDQSGLKVEEQRDEVHDGESVVLMPEKMSPETRKATLKELTTRFHKEVGIISSFAKEGHEDETINIDMRTGNEETKDAIIGDIVDMRL